jgi:uncharacterized protein (TIGR03067 family)
MPASGASALNLVRFTMIRFATLGGFVLALCAAASAEDKKDVPKELAPFQGTWKLVEVTAEGKPVPKEKLAEGRFSFEGEKVTVTEKGKVDPGSYSVDPKQEPATINFVNQKGNRALGIYKFDKDGRLILCFNKGKDAVRPKDFDDKNAVLVVLEKLKK